MTTTALDIRVAGPDDVDAVSRVGAASFRAAYEGSCSSDDLEDHLVENFSATIVREQQRIPAVTYFLATVDRVPAAIAKLRDGAIPDAVPSRKALEIPQFYVSPDYQRIGLGAALMKAVIDIVRSTPADGVWLSAWEKADWAINFYLKCGFTQVGTLDFPMGSTVYNDFLMWRYVTKTSRA